MKVHDVVRVQRGPHAGAVGVVVAVREHSGTAKVEIDGVRDDAPYSVAKWFTMSNLGGNHGN